METTVWETLCVSFLTVSESWGFRSSLRKRKAKTGTMHIAVASAIVNHTTGCNNVLWALPVLTHRQTDKQTHKLEQKHCMHARVLFVFTAWSHCWSEITSGGNCSEFLISECVNMKYLQISPYVFSCGSNHISGIWYHKHSSFHYV